MLFDFFGTLVTYRPDRTDHGYPASHDLARSWGFEGSAEAFVTTWDVASRRLEAASRRSLREFDMGEAAAAFAAEAGLRLTAEQCATLGGRFVGEWQRHLRPVDGAAALLHRLAADYSVGIVSNTHDREMVPRTLRAMGVDEVVSVVVLSVVHGRCKPHRSIYEDALSTITVGPDRAVFVGDSHDADFAGPEAIGLTAFLIDPDQRHDIPPGRRLRSVLDIESRLGAARRSEAAD